jgi:hypothetical protein
VTNKFREIVRKWVQAHNCNREALAVHFEVAPSTVDRWWIGTATPHPTLQTQIIEWIGGHTTT